MKCTRLASGTFVCGGRPFYEHEHCIVCGKPSTVLCDWKLALGKPHLPRPHKCNKPLCSEHATEVGKDRHLCPPHRADWALHPKNPKQQKDEDSERTIHSRD